MGFGPMTPLQLTKQSWRRRPSRTVFFPPQSDPPFMRKVRNNEVTNHVRPTRLKEVPLSLTPAIGPSHGGYQLTKFEPNPSICLTCSLGYKYFAKVRVITRRTC